jgi:hypothetical protein
MLLRLGCGGGIPDNGLCFPPIYEQPPGVCATEAVDLNSWRMVTKEVDQLQASSLTRSQ